MLKQFLYLNLEGKVPSPREGIVRKQAHQEDNRIRSREQQQAQGEKNGIGSRELSRAHEEGNESRSKVLDRLRCINNELKKWHNLVKNGERIGNRLKLGVNGLCGINW